MPAFRGSIGFRENLPLVNTLLRRYTPPLRKKLKVAPPRATRINLG
ncbi:MAG: hypothetical protein GAK36_00229 [Pseudomonas sp.]|nr:MAG: hypothetical protein GAK36_00229 [Pseudomonas sp.]